jgi:uncharacterized protein YqfA (UPF0365 family)
MDSMLNLTSQFSPLTIFVIAGFVIFILLLYLIPVGLWFTATSQGINISIGELLFMRWRKVPVKDVLNALIIAKREGIQTSSKQLQILYLADGDILNVVNGLVAAKKAGFEILFDKAARANIKGVDIVKAIENKTVEYINQDF